MNIGWLIRVGGIFGSVREVVELGNAMMRQGHDFTMYTDEGRDLGWLPNTLKWKHTNRAATDELDLLVWSDSPDDPYWDVFHKSPARLKAFCLMGFDPKDALGDKLLTDRHHELAQNFWMIADSPWQLSYVARHTDIAPGPAIGGVNTKMFRPMEAETEFDVMWSGDPRPRKGGDVVKAALEGLNVGTYFKKGIKQEDLAAYICKAPIFVDGHIRGGWCNPVMEAMACGRAVVCTDTPCTSTFALDGINCIKVPVDDPGMMRAAVEYLRSNPSRIVELSTSAIKMARHYAYDNVASQFRYAILERMPPKYE